MAAMDTSEGRIWPVLLAGGTGTRLWPMSRSLFPKQFMALVSNETMLAETARRLVGELFLPPIAIVNDDHRFIAGEQLRKAGIVPDAIVLEPVGRNTAPAAAVAALMVAERDPEGVLLLSPADHVIARPDAFLRAVKTALPAARNGHLVTFGIVPKRAETGYGYIERGDGMTGMKGCYALSRFTEKPDAETAEIYLASGRHFWNSGLFLMKASVYLEELERASPAVLSSAREALAKAARDLDFIRLDATALGSAPNI